MRVIGIIGSRSRNTEEDREKMEKVFWRIYQQGDYICSGGCSSGDRFADELARKTGIPIITYYAAWSRLGKSAGFIRNKLIAEKSDTLIAIVSEDRKGGTEDTIKKFNKKQKNNENDILWIV